MIYYIQLSARALVSVSGVDARAFLHGLITVDALKLAPSAPRYAALLSPQGKYLHDFFVTTDGERILLEAEKARLSDLLGRLKLYRLRASVDIVELPQWNVYALWGEGAPPAGAFADPRVAALGWRYYAEAPPEGATAASFEDYDRLRLRLGIPDGSRDLVPDRSLPLECGFEALRGVDFDKGCYVGQEVTARTKFRATLRKQFYIVHGETLPPPGTALMYADTQAGEMRSSCGGIGLALISNEIVAKSEGKLTAAGMPLAASLPGWAQGPEGAAESAGEAT